jgi:SAM-dependent methyltransferase
MSDCAKYLYNNKQRNAARRLRGLEAIEDKNTMSLLKTLMDLEGRVCLEIGAGAGSIAEWLANRVGSSGAVTATDIEPAHLKGTNYEVRRHDIEKDNLPNDEYDLIHFRHVLIHLAEPTKALRKAFASMKSGAFLLAEESDLSTWVPDDTMPEKTRIMFQSGVNAIFKVYRSRSMDIQIGTKLADLLDEVGFVVRSQSEQKRQVLGGSPEAVYQSMSANQLADSLGHDCECADSIKRLTRFLLDPEIRYQSRTTISVSAQRQA